MPHLGTMEMVVVVGVILLLFGPKRLPELARGIGKSITEFRKGARGEETDEKS